MSVVFSRRYAHRPAYVKDYQEFLVKLKRARKDAGMTQTAAARAFGIPQQVVSNMELGKRRIDAIELYHILKVYKKPWSFFEPGA